MDGMYNMLKLPEHTARFKEIRCALYGGGAVGSYLAEALAKMGVGFLTIYDYDKYSLENGAKSSSIIRMPEDVGRNKAVALAERVQAIMVPGGQAVGIDANLCSFGPRSLTEYDFVFLALDNFAAKELFNQLWMQMPKERRPIVIMGGTNGESATAISLDGEEFCLRCLFDERWLKESEVHTSCNGPQYRIVDGEEAIVRTSGLASSMAANLMAELLRRNVLGLPNATNVRLYYTASPALDLMELSPMKRKSCPDCKRIRPPEEVHFLDGTVTTMTLREAFTQLTGLLGDEKYELSAHLLEFGGVVYGGFILDDYCHCCGTPMSVLAHEGRTHFKDVLCPSCKAQGHMAHHDLSRPVGTTVQAFSPTTVDQRLLDKTLYDLGFPIGAYLYVIQRGGALDALDDNYKIMCFACDRDSDCLKITSKYE